MEKNGKWKTHPQYMVNWISTKLAKQFKKEKIVSSTNGAWIIGHPDGKEWSSTLTSHYINNELEMNHTPKYSSS